MRSRNAGASFQVKSVRAPVFNSRRWSVGPARPLLEDGKLWITVILVSILIVGWLVGILVQPSWSFAFRLPRAEAGIESVAALSELFGALVMFLFPADEVGYRLRWIGGGFLVLGTGSLVFGYLQPLVWDRPGLNGPIYSWLIAQSTACLLFIVGLLPLRCPELSRRLLICMALAFLLLGAIVEAVSDTLPKLVSINASQFATEFGKTPLLWLTGWHWIFSLVPLALACISVIGAVRLRLHDHIGGWLVLAMVMLVDSQLYNIFWPSVYTLTLTAADILRLGFAAVIIVGGVVELHRISTERTALLSTECQRYKELAEISTLKADFTRMVSHELANPLCAVDAMTDILATGALDEREQSRIYSAIKTELRSMRALVADVRTAGEIERDDFAVRAVPIALRVPFKTRS